MESSYDWNHYHRAQRWIKENRPDAEDCEFPSCWDEAWDATKEGI